MDSSELKVGDTAPDFTVEEEGVVFSLYRQLESGPVVLYFYPKDFTAGCTAEACEFRDSIGLFSGRGITVIGVSSDSEETHRSFADRYNLPFKLISDTGGEIRRLYKVRPTLGIVPGRTTFVIGKDRTIMKTFSSQAHPRRHVQEALAVLGGLTGGQ